MSEKSGLTNKLEELRELRVKGSLSEEEYELLVSRAVEVSRTALQSLRSDTTQSQNHCEAEVYRSFCHDDETSSIQKKVEAVVTTVGILFIAASFVFALLIPFDLDDRNGALIEKSCNPPAFDFYRSKLDNTLYGTYDAKQAYEALRQGRADTMDNALARVAIPKLTNVCYRPARDRMLIVAGIVALSLGSIVVVRCLRKKETT